MFFTNQPNIKMPFAIDKIYEISAEMTKEVFSLKANDDEIVPVGNYVLTKNPEGQDLNPNTHEVLWQKVYDTEAKKYYYREIAVVGAEYYVKQLNNIIPNADKTMATYNAANSALANTTNYSIELSKLKEEAEGALAILENRLKETENVQLQTNTIAWKTF